MLPPRLGNSNALRLARCFFAARGVFVSVGSDLMSSSRPGLVKELGREGDLDGVRASRLTLPLRTSAWVRASDSGVSCLGSNERSSSSSSRWPRLSCGRC